MDIFRRRASARERASRGRNARPWEPAQETWAPPWMEVGVHGTARPRRWDAVVAAEAPGLPGRDVAFTALSDGRLLVQGDAPAAALGPLAEALREALPPPYAAEAVRRGGERWAAAARSIEVVELPRAIPGHEIVLSVRGGERQLSIDDLPTFEAVPALEALGAARHEAYVVRATRLTGELWEVCVNPL